MPLYFTMHGRFSLSPAYLDKSDLLVQHLKNIGQKFIGCLQVGVCDEGTISEPGAQGWIAGWVGKKQQGIHESKRKSLELFIKRLFSVSVSISVSVSVSLSLSLSVSLCLSVSMSLSLSLPLSLPLSLSLSLVARSVMSVVRVSA